MKLAVGANAMAAMTVEGMSTRTLARVAQSVANLGYETPVVPRAAYVDAGTTANVRSAFLAGMNTRG